MFYRFLMILSVVIVTAHCDKLLYKKDAEEAPQDTQTPQQQSSEREAT
jgi:hypothetical protein